MGCKETNICLPFSFVPFFIVVSYSFSLQVRLLDSFWVSVFVPFVHFHVFLFVLLPSFIWCVCFFLSDDKLGMAQKCTQINVLFDSIDGISGANISPRSHMQTFISWMCWIIVCFFLVSYLIKKHKTTECKRIDKNFEVLNHKLNSINFGLTYSI